MSILLRDGEIEYQIQPFGMYCVTLKSFKLEIYLYLTAGEKNSVENIRKNRSTSMNGRSRVKYLTQNGCMASTKHITILILKFTTIKIEKINFPL